MKLFHLYRLEDQTGVSGTGPVVEGVEFTNGWCALRWISPKSSLCFYQSLEEVEAIHGHGGKTELIVHDFPPLEKQRHYLGNERFQILLDIIEEASHITVLAENSGGQELRIKQAIQRMKNLIQALEKTLEKNLRRSA